MKPFICPMNISTAAVLVVTALGWVWLAPSFDRTRDYAGPAACASNLRRIGDGILIYAKANQGRFPDHFGSLLAHGVDPADFVCPCSGSTPATGPTTQALAEGLAGRSPAIHRRRLIG